MVRFGSLLRVGVVCVCVYVCVCVCVCVCGGVASVGAGSFGWLVGGFGWFLLVEGDFRWFQVVCCFSSYIDFTAYRTLSS